jgi:hypothetical protein
VQLPRRAKVPDKRAHRGPHPEDARLFGASALPVLRQAAQQYLWLLDRGYPGSATLKLVGDRHRLTQRQRTAVARCSCTREQSDRRIRHELDLRQIGREPLLLDGYNVLTTVEVALGSGAVLAARDGCYRDMASMHGTYRKVAETVPALTAIGEAICELGVVRAHWYLDKPVSNSGRLATAIRALARQRGWPWEVTLVFDPDAVLAAATAPIATADSGILDRGDRWFNLARFVVDCAVPQAWIVDFVTSGN